MGSISLFCKAVGSVNMEALSTMAEVSQSFPRCCPIRFSTHRKQLVCQGNEIGSYFRKESLH